MWLQWTCLSPSASFSPLLHLWSMELCTTSPATDKPRRAKPITSHRYSTHFLSQLAEYKSNKFKCVVPSAAEICKRVKYPSWHLLAADDQHCALWRGRGLCLRLFGWKRLYQLFLLLWWLPLRCLAWKQDACASFQDWFLLTDIVPHRFWLFQSGLLDKLSVSIKLVPKSRTTGD